MAAAEAGIGEHQKINVSQSKWNAIAWNRIKETRYVSSRVLLSFAAPMNYVKNRERVCVCMCARDPFHAVRKCETIFSLELGLLLYLSLFLLYFTHPPHPFPVSQKNFDCFGRSNVYENSCMIKSRCR